MGEKVILISKQKNIKINFLAKNFFKNYKENY